VKKGEKGEKGGVRSNSWAQKVLGTTLWYLN